MNKATNDYQSNTERGIFHLSDLNIVKNKKSEQFYFELKKDYKTKLFEKALSISGTIRILSKMYKNRHGQCSGYIINVYSKSQLRKFNKSVKLIDHKRKKLEKFLNNGYKIEKLSFPKKISSQASSLS